MNNAERYALATPRAFADVDAFLDGKSIRKIAPHTYVERRPIAVHGGAVDAIVVRYHGHEIIVYTAAFVLVGHRGWPTTSTSARFQALTPFGARHTYSRFVRGGFATEPGEAEARIAYNRATGEIAVAGITLPVDGSYLTLAWPDQEGG